MAIRKALSYSKKVNRPYTRISKAKAHAYIKVNPPNKVVKYNIGNQKAFEDGRLPFVLRLISDETLVIRDTAIESGRMVLTKNLESRLPSKFYLWVKIFPHHILRNNKAAAGAGADRLSTGMKQTSVSTARQILAMAKAKLPCRTRITFEKIQPKAPVVVNN